MRSTTFYQRREGKLYVTYNDELGIVGGLLDVDESSLVPRLLEQTDNYVGMFRVTDEPGTVTAFRATGDRIGFQKNHFTLLRELALGVCDYAIFRCTDKNSGYLEYAVMKQEK